MSNQKIVTEAALSAIASDIKNALSGKANSNDVYTKTEIDNALELKADKSELYNVYPTEQESGAIAHFTDGADNIPVKSLVSQIVATGGGGTPDAPIAINGFDSGIITRCGKNFLEPTLLASSTVNGITFTALSDGTIRANGTATANAQLVINNISGGGNLLDNLLPLNNMECIGSGCPSVPGCRIAFARMDGSSFNDEKGSGVSFTVRNLTPSTNAYVRLQVDKDYTVNNVIFKPMIRIASVVDDNYEPYTSNTYTFAFGQTVHGGYFDNKGNLVVTHGYIASYNGETINEPWVSSMDNYVPNTSPSTGAQVVYPLTSPITLSITSQDIPTLLGENNFFSNTGDVEVDYHADIGLYIDKKVSSLAQG